MNCQRMAEVSLPNWETCKWPSQAFPFEAELLHISWIIVCMAATVGPLPDTRTRTEASLHLQHFQQAMQLRTGLYSYTWHCSSTKWSPWAQTAMISWDRQSQNWTDCTSRHLFSSQSQIYQKSISSLTFVHSSINGNDLIFVYLNESYFLCRDFLPPEFCWQFTDCLENNTLVFLDHFWLRLFRDSHCF